MDIDDYKRIIEQNNVHNIHEVWPNFELFLHGGTSINSYLPLFKNYLESLLTIIKTIMQRRYLVTTK